MQRVRTGCRNCRRRHKKCDELRPVCTSCSKKGETCQWPLKGDVIRINTGDSVKKSNGSPENAKTPSTVHSEVAGSVGSEVASTSPVHGEYNYDDYDVLHNVFRDYMFLNAFTTNPLEPFYLEAEALEVTHSLDNFVTEPPPPDLPQDEKIRLLNRYISEVAPWLDMFDHRNQFTSRLPLMVKERALLYSILTIASRQQEKFDTSAKERTFRLYEQCLTHLLPKVKQVPSMDIVSSCVILCCFEMMASNSPSPAWRKHLEGCAELFKTAEVNGFSGELKSAVFWCFARMDISFAIAGRMRTVIPCERWLPAGSSVYDARSLFHKNVTWNEACDNFANYSVFLMSRVLNLIFAPSLEPKEFESEWLRLFNELSLWWDERPGEMRPVEFQNPSNEVPFPKILYCVSPAISGNQLFHTSAILLMSNRPRVDVSDSGILTRPLIWHAKQIVGISLTNDHHGCLINSLQPLYVAGTLLSHPSEHKIIVDLLYAIEKRTGWSMSWRAHDLKRYWGLLDR
ncbi:unnamed protein product [Kuraishia capsulata CBS 1993]|uniref:Zn(2)-C6 fungal-type domain-containing protein n=1 Tax=Kuraishia capsulata CBS 1993 TaxID=1382522 RepID=W6MNT2_9ASCO|nr:uncharacterized protein KUCA_T00004311001 [Kuraishia capsulata CBS 1993]CDK28329.1 unnamed protein product [Kuraishia capsulata CBS 1993]